jgi:RNA polymerase sigma-70 factor, ECF subfamily
MTAPSTRQVRKKFPVPRCIFRIVTPPQRAAAQTKAQTETQDDTAQDDAVLAGRAAEGDAEAMAVLLERHFDFVHAVCRRMLRDPAAAEDARQEVLFRVASRIGSFDQRSSFRTWVFVIARNVVLNEIRTRGHTPVPAGAIGATAESDEPHADTRLDIDTVLTQLSPSRRDVIVLRYLCDLSYQEVAEVLGIPVNTVRTRLRRALGDLRVLLGNYPSLDGV